MTAAMLLALCLLLPFLTGQIPQIGTAISPMHIPVLLCGFICGWPYGLMIGFIAPILRYALFGVPVLFPMGISMAFELATYGLMTGILYRLLPKRIPYVYLALVSSMLVGRIVWGMTSFIIAGLQHTEFSFDMFLAGAFINALPGIVIHIVLIPLVVIVLKKANLMADE